MRMTASARSAEPSASAETSSRWHVCENARCAFVAPERAAEAARDARRGAQRGRQARAARGLDHDRVELLVPGDLVVDRAGVAAAARIRAGHERMQPVELIARRRAAPRAPRPPARAAPAPRRGRSGRRSRTGARARRGAARCRRAPRPRAARAPRARACASSRSAWRATRCAAADQARTHPRESPPAAPRKREGSSSGWAMIGEAAVKECIQNHAATAKATREPRILHSKHADRYLRDVLVLAKRPCISAHSRHTSAGVALVRYERMFATLDGTVDQARERRREARRRELRALCEQEARIKQRVTEIVREADDDGDWRAAGCSSSAQWLAQVSSSDHRTRRAHHAHERRAAEPAGARPRAEHGRVDARSGRGRRRVRDARDRCATRARRGRQAAERDRAGRAHARPARRSTTTRRCMSGAR